MDGCGCSAPPRCKRGRPMGGRVVRPGDVRELFAFVRGIFDEGFGGRIARVGENAGHVGPPLPRAPDADIRAGFIYPIPVTPELPDGDGVEALLKRLPRSADDVPILDPDNPDLTPEDAGVLRRLLKAWNEGREPESDEEF